MTDDTTPPDLSDLPDDDWPWGSDEDVAATPAAGHLSTQPTDASDRNGVPQLGVDDRDARRDPVPEQAHRPRPRIGLAVRVRAGLALVAVVAATVAIVALPQRHAGPDTANTSRDDQRPQARPR